MSMDIPFGTFNDELPEDRTKITAYVDCVNLERMLHEVEGHQVTVLTKTTDSGKEKVELGGREERLAFRVDEPPRIGGDGEFPQPLTYIAGASAPDCSAI